LIPENEQFKNNLQSAYWNLGEYFKKTGDTNKAIETYQQLLKLNSDNQDVYCALAQAYYDISIYTKAIEYFKMALKIDENSEIKQNLFLTYGRFGHELINQRKYKDAIIQFEESLKIKPNDISTLINIGVAYERSQQFDQALATYKKVLALEPKNEKIKQSIINLHINQGNKNMQVRKYKSATTEFEKIPEKERSAEISSLLGYLYIVRNKPISALPHLNRALEINPDDKSAYQNLRSIESDFKIKFAKNKNSQEIKNNLALIRCSLAQALIYKKESLNAKAKLRRALNLAPQSSDVKKVLVKTCINLAKSFQAKKWHKNASEVAKWVLELEPDNELAKSFINN